MEGSLGRGEWARLPRPMAPVIEPRYVRVPRHSVVWIALGLVAGSMLVLLGVLARVIGEMPLGSGAGASVAVGVGPMLAVVVAPAAVAFSAGWVPWHGALARWVLLVGSAAFAVGNVLLHSMILTSDSSTAAIGFIVVTPVLLAWAGLTWGATEAANWLVPPVPGR